MDEQSIEKFTDALQDKFGNRYAEIKTTSGNEIVAFIHNVCCITSNNEECLVTLQVSTHLLDTEIGGYRIEKLDITVTLSELIKLELIK